MQKFHSERWHWWPHAVTMGIFSVAIIAWVVRLTGGGRAGVLEWLYVLGLGTLTLASVLQLKSGVTIDEQGISMITTLGSSASRWEDISSVLVTTPEKVMGKFSTRYLRAGDDVVLVWHARLGRASRPSKLRARIPGSELPALLLTLSQAPAPVTLDLPR